jgi:hypothetical protein
MAGKHGGYIVHEKQARAIAGGRIETGHRAVFGLDSASNPSYFAPFIAPSGETEEWWI